MNEELGLDIQLHFVFACEIDIVALDWLKSAKRHAHLTYEYFDLHGCEDPQMKIDGISENVGWC